MVFEYPEGLTCRLGCGSGTQLESLVTATIVDDMTDTDSDKNP
jgi:hypothetical protein